jgi:hypothetical protein
MCSLSRFRSEQRKVQRYATRLRERNGISTKLKQLYMTCSNLEVRLQEEKEQASEIAVIAEQQSQELRNRLKKSNAEIWVAW